MYMHNSELASALELKLSMRFDYIIEYFGTFGGFTLILSNQLINIP